jgi:hypothetical protein
MSKSRRRDTLANAINRKGQIVGDYANNGDHQFLGDHGVFTAIDVPGTPVFLPMPSGSILEARLWKPIVIGVATMDFSRGLIRRKRARLRLAMSAALNPRRFPCTLLPARVGRTANILFDLVIAGCCASSPSIDVPGAS